MVKVVWVSFILTLVVACVASQYRIPTRAERERAEDLFCESVQRARLLDRALRQPLDAGSSPDPDVSDAPYPAKEVPKP